MRCNSRDRTPRRLSVGTDDGILDRFDNRKVIAAVGSVALLLLVTGLAVMQMGLLSGLPGGSGDKLTVNGNTVIVSRAVGNQANGVSNVSVFEENGSSRDYKGQLNLSTSSNSSDITVTLTEQNGNSSVRAKKLSLSDETENTVEFRNLSSGTYVLNATAPDGTTQEVELRLDGNTTTTDTPTSADTTAETATTSTSTTETTPTTTATATATPTTTATTTTATPTTTATTTATPTATKSANATTSS